MALTVDDDLDGNLHCTRYRICRERDGCLIRSNGRFGARGEAYGYRNDGAKSLHHANCSQLVHGMLVASKVLIMNTPCGFRREAWYDASLHDGLHPRPRGICHGGSGAGSPIAGRVTSLSSGEPIATGQVTLKRSNHKDELRLDGVFVLRQVPVQAVTLVVTSPGFHTQEIIVPADEEVVFVTLAPVTVTLEAVVVPGVKPDQQNSNTSEARLKR